VAEECWVPCALSGLDLIRDVVLFLQGTKDFMSSMGLGMVVNQLADLKLGELLDTPPPGLDEAVAIAKVG
jgi:hypothetical protein